VDADSIKSMVKDKYGAIAKAAGKKQGCGCSSGCCDTGVSDVTVLSEDYSKLEGYVPDADLNLGCGIPVDSTKIKKGDVVVDLGSGAGNDCFVARRLVGDKGKVIGVDMTGEMIKKARQNNKKMGYANVEFRLGEIEKLPVEDNTADVVISNCVLNLVPDKRKAFAEIKRVLKPGGRFSISDIVMQGELPEKLKTLAELYAGCVAGALQKAEYLGIIKETGFKGVSVEKEKEFQIPDDMLAGYLKPEEIKSFRASGVKVLSVTVIGEKA